MKLAQPMLQYINTVTHEGKVILFATCQDGSITYSVRQDGFEDSYDVLTGWEKWKTLELPNESPDQSVETRQAATLTYTKDDQQRYFYRSLYKTDDQTAAAPVQLVSGIGHLYVFRQSKAGTLFVDRFVLDGITNTLVRKLDVRFKRSGQKFTPLEKTTSAKNDKLAVVDSLDFRDANGMPFYEPTTELSIIDNLQDGYFTVVLVPTNEHDSYRWHVFVCNADGHIEHISMRASDEGLFDATDYLLLEPAEEDGERTPRQIPGITRRTISFHNGLKAQGAPAATRYDVQVERQTKGGMQLLREATRVSLVVPTSDGAAAAIDFGIGTDGMLAQIGEPLSADVLRSVGRDVLLPLDTLDEIRAIGRIAPPQGKITRVERSPDDDDRIAIHTTKDDAFKQIKAGSTIKLSSTNNYNG